MNPFLENDVNIDQLASDKTCDQELHSFHPHNDLLFHEILLVKDI